ncbi:hypothetical protein BB934_03610 [Microvirga ossetica]|uniref:Uncharacterized protein n=1 Tax=Microvirga ossetica TaxID=1882682 RepID=A0A1B2EBS2_9HYPH|nr:hypothetical protein BB934_03610 [Microvirga ossetica]
MAFFWIGRFVADLPELDTPWFSPAVCPAFAMIWIVAVADKIRCVLSSSRPPFLPHRVDVFGPTITCKIDSKNRLSSYLLTQTKNFVDSNLVRLHASPKVVDHRLTVLAGTNTLLPSPITGQDPTPPYGTWSQVADYCDEVLAPFVTVIVPCGLDRGIG